MIVFKERGRSLGMRVRRSLHIPPNVRVRATTNGWMTAQEYQHWLAHVYGKESPRRLLIVDSYKPHQTDDRIKKVKESCNSDVIIIPGGSTLHCAANGQMHKSTLQGEREGKLAGVDAARPG